VSAVTAVSPPPAPAPRSDVRAAVIPAPRATIHRLR
jgi:hypothetical protein